MRIGAIFAQWRAEIAACIEEAQAADAVSTDLDPIELADVYDEDGRLAEGQW